MKNLLTRFAFGWVAVASLALTSGCAKDETKVVLNQSSAPQLSASATTASLVPASPGAAAVTYTATRANFGYAAGVTYTLQLAKKGSNFASPQQFELGADLKKTLTSAELNGVYNNIDCGISTPTPTMLEARVKATVGASVDPVYSNVQTVVASPYQAQTPPADTWAIIGSATPGSWNADTPLTYDFCSRTYKAEVVLTNLPSNNEFKFRSNGVWTVNLGDGGEGDAFKPAGRQLVYNMAPTPNPPNISLTEAGTYLVTLDLNSTPKPTFTLVKK